MSLTLPTARRVLMLRIWVGLVGGSLESVRKPNSAANDDGWASELRPANTF
jgi:hypothetical protein